ncbi:AIPR family protein [Bradyrhizobium pachyrhizi]|uniref:AIPR family protein n=1 Tax=Bradyrhizobium pachyrhizi TaxID=280333 RepID=UPI0024B13753|nr:AIPR family protein [Bradyrhizobium pachyrhizi]WFU55726.1 AIPR family protein [Bradyrhizobium pachyrhizi]
MSDEAIETFARELAAEVEEAIRSGDASIYSEEEFTRIVLDRLGDEGAIENPTLLWQEGNFARTKYKITGYSIPDDEERLVLVTTIHTGELPPRALNRDEILTALQQAMKFYECSCKGLHTKIEPSNTDASELARHIHEAREEIGVLRIVLLSDGLTGLRSIDLKKAFDGTRIIVDLFGIERLQRILGEGLRRDDIVVDFNADFRGPLPCLKASSGSADYDAYLVSIPGPLLADVYEKYGTRLLELNVRAFLGLRGRKSVNAGLRTTIRELPHRFLAYNNGIVATVDAMEVEDHGNGQFGIKSVRGLQIVNGGQTTASLHRAKKQDGADLDAISVPAKIICVGGGADLDEMVAAVSKSANSQNTVQPADFSANDPFHVAVEKLANNTWLSDGKGRWFYERARGSYGAAELKASFAAAQKRRFAQETPKERRFSKTDLAKYLNAWEGQAQQVSFGNQKNFQFFMQSVKDEHPDGFEPDAAWYKAFVAKAILFRTAQSIVKAKKFAAFQANIIAYTIACLSWATGGRLDFDMIWTRQAISPELHKLLESWVGKVDKALRKTAGNRMVSEWAKKVDCRDALRELSFDLPDKLPPELANRSAAAKGSGRSKVQHDELRP